MNLKASEIAKKIAHDRAFVNPISGDELEPHMGDENVTPGKLGKVQGALTSLGESMAKRWKLVEDTAAPKKKKRKK